MFHSVIGIIGTICKIKINVEGVEDELFNSVQGFHMMNSAQPKQTYSLLKIIVWTLLFQLAWNWGRVIPVMMQGELVGPDDFLRLHQVQNWMAGQGWYDISAARMFPPNGADIHWSRLVDVPIAGLIWLLDIVFDTKTATRLTTVLWPSFLLAAVVVVLTLICDRLLKSYNRLLPMLFAVLCITSIAQFLPGRIDHHNVQILLFSLTILGFVSRETFWGDYLMGFAMVFSISIGLDTAALTLIILAYLGYEWAIGHDENGRGLVKVAVAIIISTIMLFLLNFDPATYLYALDSRCDANSAFYAAALLLLSGAFIVLAMSSRWLNNASVATRLIMRCAAGAAVSISALLVLLMLFPDCANGPYGAVSDEAKARWLTNVGEASSLGEVLKRFPSEWLGTVCYLAVILLAGLYALFQPKYSSAKLIALYVLLLACALGTLWQIRVLRIGIYMSIPFCVIIADISWQFLIKRYANAKPLAYGLQLLVVAALVSVTWTWAGQFIFPKSTTKVENTVVSQKPETNLESFKRNTPSRCFADSDYEYLSSLPVGIVMTDLYSATTVLVHSPHTVISGPYHRNERGILDVLDFFGPDIKISKALADKYKLNYVSFCMNSVERMLQVYPNAQMAARIKKGDLPDWLEEVSPKDSPVKVLKVLR
ncbi:MAG: hypothetical protein COB78_06900 [Hyphomicrobiales bacterium]|nr:MAG: hypothetical protein COB78_06900 [Hyphomicrobiales bacterium]